MRTPAILLVLAAHVAGCDPGLAPRGGGGDPFAVARDGDGARELPGLPGNPLANKDGDEDEVYICTHGRDCFDKCPKPRFDDGSTLCSCTQLGNLTWECRVRDLRPGEELEGGGGGDDDHWKCGDLRDTLAAEYVEKKVPQAPGGSWDCHVFHKDPRYIVDGEGIEWGVKHSNWGYVDANLSLGMAAVENHFRTFYVTSGYRCPVGNSSISGASDESAHMRGRAADFQPLVIPDSTWTWEYKGKLIEWALDNTTANEGFRYTNKNHVHLGFNVKK